MNQFGPQWDTRPPNPADYRPGTPGPYTSPAPAGLSTPCTGHRCEHLYEQECQDQPRPCSPFPHKPRKGGLIAALGALGGLTILGLWVSATTDHQKVPVPNSGVQSTYDPGLYTPEPTNTTYTPNAHKPGPKVASQVPRAGLNAGGLLVVGRDVKPGVYRSVVVPRWFFGREDSGYCYVSRLNTITPHMSDVRTAYDHAPTGPIIADASYRETGELVTLKILASDKAVEVDCGDAIWVRVR